MNDLPTIAIRIAPADDVAIALVALPQGQRLCVQGVDVVTRNPIPAAHKIALRDIGVGRPVVKYGHPIGVATRSICAGDWVHVHNLRSALQEDREEYCYEPRRDDAPVASILPETFQGFKRGDGRYGIRNELWILPTVGCVNRVASALERKLGAELARDGVDGVYAFPHPYGCSQLGDDHDVTKRLLAGLARHPNAGGVLVLGLGCENNTMEAFREALSPYDPDRVRFLTCQEVEDEYEAAARCLVEIAAIAQCDRREPAPASCLCVGLKCGGSDAYSGITANPLLGHIAERLVAQGGAVSMTEVPEMFGAERPLMNRCSDHETYDDSVAMVTSFKAYYREHGHPVYENPSPGNKEGGITTLEEKSLGCVQKAGRCPVVDVLTYGDPVVKPGLSLVHGPGNDMVSVTVLAASGAHLELFTTGRGTPFGGPVPTLKIASNTPLARAKQHWIDFDAGALLSGETLESLADALWRQVLDVASGARLAKNEIGGFREIALFKRGVTL